MAYRWEKNPINGQEAELVIDGWENGIGASPEKGVNIKNCNIESVPGTVRPNWALTQLSTPNNLSFDYTVNFSGPGVDVIDITGTGSTTINLNLQAVQFTTTGTPPGGISLNTTYWLTIFGGLGAAKYKIAASLADALAGNNIAIHDAGTGIQTLSNAAVTMQTINYFSNVPININGSVTYVQFALDSVGQVWYYYSQTSWVLVIGNNSTTDRNGGFGTGTGNGLVWFQSSGTASESPTSYLFVVGTASVDVLNVSTFYGALTPTWQVSWMLLKNSTIGGFSGSHYAHLAQDNKIYICDQNQIAQIAEIATKNFNPTDSTTYTQNGQALTLPTYSTAQCLEELGANLLIGDQNTNRIYPWDKQSVTFSQPLRVAEKNIWRMKNVDNTIYCLAGTKGHIYQTTGYAFTREMKIPEYLSGGYIANWGGIEAVSGALLFGVGPLTTAGTGVYKLYTNVGQFQGSVVGSLICDETPVDSNNNPLLPTALLTDNVPDEFYMIGTDGAIFGINPVLKLQNYEAYVESDLIRVGTKLQNKTFNSIEFLLDYPPSSGGLRLSWRDGLGSSYTVIKDFDCTNLISDIQTPANITNVQYVQIKAELKGGSGYDTPRLREIRLR